ncbi:MAG: sugar phosphate isomerase/epimerase family protein [Vicinamibacterales bacterium]|jgi:sugar phosphate isomerase/epimerase
MTNRRDFSRAAAAAAVWPVLSGRLARAAPVAGVPLGVQTYSFREIARPAAPEALDVVLQSMNACGVDECELWSPQIELAAPAARDGLRRWRAATGPAYYESVRGRFTSAGATIYAYNYSFAEHFTDEEITHGFMAARALGAQVITASTTVRMARRLVPFAEAHRIPVAMHNHSQVHDPNEFATPESFAAALALSPLFRINLDIGHFTAAGYDALAYLAGHHDRITNLHLKDRRQHQGDNVPWGRGDTPIVPVLRWLKEHRSPVRAFVEYEYAGTRGPVAEVSACLAYARRALDA